MTKIVEEEEEEEGKQSRPIFGDKANKDSFEREMLEGMALPSSQNLHGSDSYTVPGEEEEEEEEA